MNKIINVGQTGSSQNTRVIDSEGISYAVTNGEKDGVPKIISAGYVNDGKHQQDFIQHEDGISRAMCCGTHGSGPHLTKTLVSEPSENWQTVVGNKQLEILEPQIAAMRGRNPDNPSERRRSNGR